MVEVFVTKSLEQYAKCSIFTKFRGIIYHQHFNFTNLLACCIVILFCVQVGVRVKVDVKLSRLLRRYRGGVEMFPTLSQPPM
jgi:hypothetical protein